MNTRRFLFLFILLALLALPFLAAAEEAQDLTAQCTIAASSKENRITRLSDRNYSTAFKTETQRTPSVTVTAPKDAPVYGLYLCFGDKLYPWEIQAKRKGEWQTVYQSEGLYAHEYAPLPEGETEMRLLLISEKKKAIVLNELYAFGPGDLPAFVQQWQPAPEKADLLVLSAHPDDEILFFGGTIPTYAGEKGLNVVVAYMTSGNNARRSELLNGLWEMGVRTYPEIGPFWDKFSRQLQSAYSEWGKSKVYAFVVQLLRRYQPEVVVTHDVNGEYGHGAHRVCADAMQHCVITAADPEKFSDTAEKYGVWQVKKLYLHLYQENAVEMDWDQPLSAFGGRTAYEVAKDGYGWHVSQHEMGQKNPDTGKFEVFVVEPRESKYSCYRFGLAYTAVGPDVEKNNFMENIPGY